jgi:hypothetical protein
MAGTLHGAGSFDRAPGLPPPPLHRLRSDPGVTPGYPYSTSGRPNMSRISGWSSGCDSTYT